MEISTVANVSVITPGMTGTPPAGARRMGQRGGRMHGGQERASTGSVMQVTD